MTENPDLIEEYLAWLAHNKGRKDATIVKYRGTLTRLAGFLVERESGLLQASSELLEEFTGLQAHKEGLSPKARHPRVAAVKGFYRWLLRREVLPTDPSQDVPYPEAGLRLPIPMGYKHAERLLMQPDLDTFIGLRDAAMLSVLIGCGLRVSGLLSLNHSSLLFDRIENRDVLVIKAMEKGKRERLVPAPDECRILIRAYLGHEELAGIDARLPNGDQVLFVSVQNRVITPDKYHGEARRLSAWSVNEMIKRYARQAGIPEHQAHPHALRHLYGTQLTENDVPTLIIQALMGHADPKTTEIYTHLATGKLRKTIDRANPLSSMNTPISGLVRELRRRGA